jgi:mycofactocin precursor
MSLSSQLAPSDVDSSGVPASTVEQDIDAQVDDADLLVEDVSIDGMCGVY